MGKDLCRSCYKNEKPALAESCSECLANPKELAVHMKRHEELMKEDADQAVWNDEICSGCKQQNKACTCSSTCENCGIEFRGKFCHECQGMLKDVNLEFVSSALECSKLWMGGTELAADSNSVEIVGWLSLEPSTSESWELH